MSFISYLVNGLSLGSVYALIALGYTMVYGIAKMLNFAHGDVIMIGASVKEEISGQFFREDSFNFTFTLRFFDIGCIAICVFNCNIEDRIIALDTI